MAWAAPQATWLAAHAAKTRVRACSRWYRTCRAHRRARAWQKRRRKRRFPRRCRRRRRERPGCSCRFDAPEAGEGVIGSTLRRICRCRRARRHPNRACRQRRLYHHGRHCACSSTTTHASRCATPCSAQANRLWAWPATCRGKRSDVHVTTRYVGHGEEAIDFNYATAPPRREDHAASWTRNGVLTDESHENPSRHH